VRRELGESIDRSASPATDVEDREIIADADVIQSPLRHRAMTHIHSFQHRPAGAIGRLAELSRGAPHENAAEARANERA
jgi:hypothetical protein